VVVGGVWPELGVIVSANNEEGKFVFTLEAVKHLRFVAAIHVEYSALAFPIF
jgi:hypothetical protein